MASFIQHLPYIGVVTVLLLSGFGLPLPEDVPLLLGGALCGQGKARIEIMLPLTFAAVLLADLTVYGMGRRYGEAVTRFPFIRRYLTPDRLERAAGALHDHCGKTLFTARFLPGLRSPIYFTAGTFRIPFWKMLLFDGVAALISVPTLVLAAYFFSDQLDRIRELSHEVQIGLAVVVVFALVGLFFYKRMRRRAAGQTDEMQVGSLPSLRKDQAA